MINKLATQVNITNWSEVKSQYFGVDLHKDQITWHCITRTKDDQVHHAMGTVLTACLQQDFIPRLNLDFSYLIVEASCSTFFFYGQVAPFCKKVYVVNPAAFRELYMTGKKTDKIDAKKLADRLMYHVEMNDSEDNFPSVYIPDQEALEVRKLVTTYNLLVKQITQLKNQLKAVFRAKMISLSPEALDKGLAPYLTYSQIDSADRTIAQSIEKAYQALRTEKDRIKEAILIMGIGRFRKEVELLTTITGISSMTAIVFMSDIVTVQRFPTPGRMTSYLASVGKVDASGQTVKNGSLNKRGRRTTYRFILQGIEHVIQGNIIFERFVKRHSSKRYSKVRAALVRKTFVIMYYMLKNDEPYRYFDERIYKRKKKEISNIEQKVA